MRLYQGNAKAFVGKKIDCVVRRFVTAKLKFRRLDNFE